eukprot:10079647-Ditylum_brightwellii.AAC.1
MGGESIEIRDKEEHTHQNINLDIPDQASVLQKQHRAKDEYLQKVLNCESYQQESAIERQLKAGYCALKSEGFNTSDQSDVTINDSSKKEQLCASLKNCNEAIKAGLERRQIMDVGVAQSKHKEHTTDKQMEEINKEVTSRLKEEYLQEM